MSRKIKFRAWDKEWANFTIDEGENWLDFNGGCWMGAYTKGHTPNREIIRDNNLILMQYTGLKDKNGKEIYEGDITFAKWNKPHIGKDDGTARVVIWSDQLGGWGESRDGKDGQWSSYLKTHALENTKVIGNIYENPELLEIHNNN